MTLTKSKGSASLPNKPRYRYENVQCIECYDADTITAIIDFGMKLTQEVRVRLARINAPEVKGPETPQGKIARDFLRKRILNQPIVLESLKFEKYGRLLCEVYDQSGKNINDELVRVNLAQYKDYE